MVPHHRRRPGERRTPPRASPGAGRQRGARPRRPRRRCAPRSRCRARSPPAPRDASRWRSTPSTAPSPRRARLATRHRGPALLVHGVLWLWRARSATPVLRCGRRSTGVGAPAGVPRRSLWALAGDGGGGGGRLPRGPRPRRAPLLARADERGDPSVAVGVRAALAELWRGSVSAIAPANSPRTPSPCRRSGLSPSTPPPRPTSSSPTPPSTRWRWARPSQPAPTRPSTPWRPCSPPIRGSAGGSRLVSS